MMRISLFLLALVFCQSATGQSLQSPEEFLGYKLGDRFTRHHQIVEYFNYVADQRSNVKIHKYGETNEERPLIVTFISAQKNIDRLDEIREDNLKRAGLMEGSPSGEKVAIVWLSYTVHGNESSSSEAALKTLYTLTGGKDDRVDDWLENTVVIMDPCINPDGRDRWTNHYYQYKNVIPNPDLNSKEHNEYWPAGRTNHYMFDLNRDWAWATQIESQQRIGLYNTWMPHVHVDFHEQGLNNPYYFPPAAEPYHEVITPWQREFQRLIGTNHARYFDEEGWIYFTKEVFDLLYPSYGDTYPTYNGAIGMTYEKGGGASVAALMENEDTVTLYDRLQHHHITGLSTVEVSSTNAGRLVDEFEKYFTSSGANTKYKSFVIRGTNDDDVLQRLTDWLELHQISYGSGSSRKALSGFNYRSGRNEQFSVADDDLVINLSQPKGRLVRSLFDPDTYLADTLTYDLTAWAIPYVYDLDAFAVAASIPVNKKEFSRKPAETSEAENPYGFILDYSSLEDQRFVAKLFQNKIKIRVATQPFQIEGKSFNRGSILMLRWDNEHVAGGYARVVNRLATESGRSLTIAKSGFVQGGKDFGSSDYEVVSAPRVAIVGGAGIRSLRFGELWYHFEQVLQYPVTVLDTDYLSYVDLAEYDVLVLPGGGSDVINDRFRGKLSDWTREGGRLVVMDQALRSFVDSEEFNLKSFRTEEEEKEADEFDESQTEKNLLLPYAQKERDRLSGNAYGAIFKVKLDNTHPLAYGYRSDYFSLKTTGARYAWLEDGWNVGTLGGNVQPESGFVGVRALKRLNNTLVFGAEEKGSGNVVYFVDNPLFRAFWEGGKLMFGNSIFMPF